MMTASALLRPTTLLAALAALLLLTTAAAAADYVPPRVSYVDGGAGYEPAGEIDWEEVTVNLPLLSGDRIFSHPDSRVEIELGYDNFLRLGQETDLTFTRAGEKETELTLSLGDLILRVNESSRFTVRTPHASVKIKKEGLYRISVYEDGTARVAVRKGRAEVENYVRNRKVKSGEELFIDGPQSGLTQVAHSWTEDEFDLWSGRRDAQFVSVRSTQYVGGRYAGVYDLDRYGDWRYVAGYGNLWFPSYSAGWAPYRIGRWIYYPSWGWTWISYEPWGWLPYHYGSWIYYAPYNRWCWYPRRFSRWSPALVNFYFGNGYVGWTPRGWRDDGRGNVTVINNNNTTIINTGGVDRTRPGRGLTVVTENDFGARRPDRTHIADPDQSFVENLRPGLPSDLPERTRRVQAGATAAAPAAAGPRVIDVSPQSGQTSETAAPTTPGVRRGWSGRTADSVGTRGATPTANFNELQRERPAPSGETGSVAPERRTRRAAPAGVERPSANRPDFTPSAPPRSAPRGVTPAPSGPPSVAPSPRPSPSRRVTPRQSSPSRVSPRQSSPRRVQPRQSPPRRVAPQRSTPRRVAPQRSTPRRAPAPPRPKQNRKPPM